MKTALVTAAASGVGRAIASTLSREGFRVWAHWHRTEPNIEGSVIPVQADLRRPEERERLARDVSVEGLSVLVNNLGIYPEQDLDDMDLDRFEEVFSLTCTVTFDLIRRLRPALVRRAPSHVVNVGDSGADRIEARRQATPYHIAKLGVHVLTRTYAQILGPEGVRVNMVSPGFLENSVGQPDSPIPLGRPGACDEVAEAVRWLVSGASSYTSGTNLLVNGGWNLG
jgi:3-oxoacyl-[acyl-carrier protein] reductase